MKCCLTIIIKEGDTVKNSISISITISPAQSGGGGTPSPDLEIDASGVPTSGEVGVPFSGAIKVSGGAPPYIFSLANGALPDGVSLMSDGSFSGTPTKDGSFSFEIGVSDAGA
jgi:putative Ig domain-containing protein